MSFPFILLLVPFVVFFGPWSPCPKCIRDSQPRVRGIVYIVASFYQHTECVYLGNPNIQEIYLHTKLIIHYLHDRYTFIC